MRSRVADRQVRRNEDSRRLLNSVGCLGSDSFFVHNFSAECIEGVDKETAKKIVKTIKESGIKVQSSIMDEQVRVTGKKLDDLQAVMAIVKKMPVELPLQFINFRN